MSNKNKVSLYQQAFNSLKALQSYGRSKHDDKKMESVFGLERGAVTFGRIYSFQTFQSYLKQCNYFISYCMGQKMQGKNRRPYTLEECKPFIEPFIRHQEGRGLSAYTVKLQLSAIEKMYQQKFEIKTKSVARQDIKRSRGEAVRDKHFSAKNNADLVNCCRCVGFRRSELEKAKAEDLKMIDGRPFMQIKGKGGRVRLAPVVGTDEEVKSAVEYIKGLNGFNSVPVHADIHSYRAEYATKIYRMHERPFMQIKGVKIDYTAITGKTGNKGERIYKSALYYCRNEKSGTALDREAMIEASRALGHNRESVVGEHYLRL